MEDKLDYDRGIPKAIWRGAVYQELPEIFLRTPQFFDFCDVADTSRDAMIRRPKNYLSVTNQLHYKVVCSVEVNDVASNLKWIMFPNSLFFTQVEIRNLVL